MKDKIKSKTVIVFIHNDLLTVFNAQKAHKDKITLISQCSKMEQTWEKAYSAQLGIVTVSYNVYYNNTMTTKYVKEDKNSIQVFNLYGAGIDGVRVTRNALIDYYTMVEHDREQFTELSEVLFNLIDLDSL